MAPVPARTVQRLGGVLSFWGDVGWILDLSYAAYAQEHHEQSVV